MNPRHAIVIGAGISGLACALKLKELGVSVRVLEASNRAGGLIITEQREGFLFESAPQSFQLTSQLRELIRLAGCESELIEANPQLPRYVLRGGKLHPAPMSPPAVLTSSLLSVGSRMRVLTEPFRRSQPAAQDESFADFVRRRFGTEILEHLAGPFVSGVFAGDPEKLSLRSAFPSLAVWEAEYGSVIRGAMKSRGRGARVRPTSASFRGGMATLLNSAARKLESILDTGVTVSSIRPSPANTWALDYSKKMQPATLSTDAVVLAIPAYTAANLLSPVAQRIASTLAGIPYSPIVVVSQGYRREHVGHALNGFGLLVPRTEKLRTLGVIWNSSLFPSRCPKGTVEMTSFLGGATDPGILDIDDVQIGNHVHREIAGVLQITAPPIAQRVWRHEHALPQYNLGHMQKVGAIRDEVLKLRGLFITGNYLEGPSIGSCVSEGFRTAQSVCDYLSLPVK